jgi:copper transport protein
MRTVGRRGVTVVGLAVWLLLLLAGVASAHAELIETNPANGAHLDRAPREVVLRFSETVAPVRGGFSVLDRSGKAIAQPVAGSVDGDGGRVRMPLPDPLGDGVYVVNWRVVSADSHPVHGAFVFSVGTAQAAPLGNAGAQAGADGAVGMAFWLFRLAGYISLTVMIGGSFFVVACWPAGRPDTRVHRLIRVSWLAAVVSAVGSLALQGAYATGTGLLTALDPALLADTLATTYGILLLARIVLLVLAGYVLLRLVRAPAEGESLSRKQIAVFAVLGLALAATWSGAGHPAAAGGMIWAALPLDVLHLVAVSVWLGGLVVLAGWTLRRRTRAGEDEAVAAVAAYSKAAAVAVAVLGATGLLQAWRELAVSGPGGEYFALLVFKVGAFGLLIWLAALSRAAVRTRLTPGAGTRRPASRKTQQDMLTRLRASVRWEVVIAGVVLALTAALVATPPGGHDHGPAAVAEAASGGPFSQAFGVPGGDVQVWVNPARSGPNQFVVNVRDGQGINRDVPAVSGELSLPANNIGPLPVALAKTGRGQFVADKVEVPVAGTWQLTLKVRVSDFDESTVDAQVQVR